MGRSDEQLAHALNALLDELLELLEDLRGDLIADLRDYEGELQHTLGEIPDFIYIDPETVEVRFRPNDDEDSMIGPRMVAVIALDVEEFVSSWVGNQEAVVGLDFDPALVQEYRQNCADLEQLLTDYEADARRCASDLVSSLGDQLEDVLEVLQDDRDADEKALADLVTDGAVDKGKSQLHENADVWERYRAQAESVTELWGRLEALAFEGVDRTIHGLERLRNIIRAADTGLSDIYPELAVEVSRMDVPDRETPEERETLELDRENLGESDDSAPDEDHERRTVELSRVEMTRESERPMASDDIDDAADTIHDVKEEAAPIDDEEESDVEDDGEDVVDDEREVFFATRQLSSWQLVPRLEIGIVWGIPAVFFAVVAIATLAPGAVDPIDRFPWLWAVCVVIGVAVLAVPLLRGWRAHVRGGSVRLETKALAEEEIQVELNEDSVAVGDSLVRRVNAELYRWEQFNPPEIGWVIKSNGLMVGTRETNVTRWEDSAAKRKERLETMWVVPPHEFWNMCESLELKR